MKSWNWFFYAIAVAFFAVVWPFAMNGLAWYFCNPVLTDDVIAELLPSYARRVSPHSNEWAVRVVAITSEPANIFASSSIWLCGQLASYAGYEAKIWKHRVTSFLRDFDRGKYIQISSPDEWVSVEANELGPSSADGLITNSVRVHIDEGRQDMESSIRLKIARDNPHLEDTGSIDVPLVDYHGISIISDIDDTIKITGVGNLFELLEATLLSPFRAVPSVAIAYRLWAEEKIDVSFAALADESEAEGVTGTLWTRPHFHYLSSSLLPVAAA